MIEQTEVTITPKPLNLGMEAKVTKVAGSVGEQYVRLYPIDDNSNKAHSVQFLGISFRIDRNINLLQIYSSIPGHPLRHGDKVDLLFEDGSKMEVFIDRHGTRHINGRLNFVPFTDEQLLQLFKIPLVNIVLYNNRSQTTSEVTFLKNSQYQSYSEGQKLMLILGKRVAEAKLTIVQKYGRGPFGF